MLRASIALKPYKRCTAASSPSRKSNGDAQIPYGPRATDTSAPISVSTYASRETVLRWALGGEGTLPCLSSLSLSRYASATQCKLLLGPAVTVLSHLKGDKAEFVPLLNVQWHWCTALRSIIKTSHPQWEYWCACVWCCNVLSMAQTTPLPLQWKTRVRKPAACDWRETVWPAST